MGYTQAGSPPLISYPGLRSGVIERGGVLADVRAWNVKPGYSHGFRRHEGRRIICSEWRSEAIGQW